jgi:hypothetical protein
MRDRYYRLASSSQLPQGAVLVHLYHRLGRVLARVEGDIEEDEAQPDLILFRAALMRLRENAVGIFVLLEDAALWQHGWGDLVEYRGGSRPVSFSQTDPDHGVIPAQAGTAVSVRDVRGVGPTDAWDYTLNLNSITSPSLTT